MTPELPFSPRRLRSDRAKLRVWPRKAGRFLGLGNRCLTTKGWLIKLTPSADIETQYRHQTDLGGTAPKHGSMSPRLQTQSRFLCHCLGVTEDEVRDAHVECPFRDLDEVRRRTGAGDGCTACRSRVERFLKSGQSAS